MYTAVRAFAVGLVLLLAAPALGQKAPIDPAGVAAAKELLVAMGSMKQFEVAIGTMTTGMGQAFKQQQPGKAREIDDVMAALAAKFNARKEEVLAMIAPLYAEKVHGCRTDRDWRLLQDRDRPEDDFHARTAEQALDAFRDIPITRHPHTELLGRVWKLRHNLTAYDAVYLALANSLEAELLTLDEGLLRATNKRRAR